MFQQIEAESVSAGETNIYIPVPGRTHIAYIINYAHSVLVDKRNKLWYNFDMCWVQLRNVIMTWINTSFVLIGAFVFV